MAYYLRLLQSLHSMDFCNSLFLLFIIQLLHYHFLQYLYPIL